jgi:adenylate cyclase
MNNIAAGHPATLKGHREDWLRTARLTSGLILTAFVALHLANHTLALVSIDTAETASDILMAPWRNPVGGVVLLIAALTHLGLTLLALYRRRSLVMPVKEAAQLLLGLAIPVLIAEHVLGTKIYGAMTGGDANYAFVANALWVQMPLTGVKQVVAVLVIWAHGCIGIYFWLRYRSWFASAAPYLLVFAALLPTLALLGFVNAGRAVEATPAIADQGVPKQCSTRSRRRKFAGLYVVYTVYGAILGLVLTLRILRTRRERRDLVEVRYPDGRSIRVPKGFSVLEASRLAGIPHHAVCGGRGRCSTCRVRVLEGISQLPPPELLEQATLARIHAEPDVRLACQLRPREDLSVIPLLSAGTSGTGTLSRPRPRPAANRTSPCSSAIFAVLPRCPTSGCRSTRYSCSTATSPSSARRSKKPAAGWINSSATERWRSSASTPRARKPAGRRWPPPPRSSKTLPKSARLAAELREPLRVAIGIHAGAAIAGSMGYGRVMGVTVIGDTVNIASRLESVAKELDASLVISGSAAALSGVDFLSLQKRTVDIRGHSKPLKSSSCPSTAGCRSMRQPAQPPPETVSNQSALLHHRIGGRHLAAKAL